jgi:hypothetical protein
MTNYTTANAPAAVKAAVLAAIECIHNAGICLTDKAIAMTIIAEIATQMKDHPEVNTRDWQTVVNEWGD